MPRTDADRLADEALHPRVLRLRRALVRLRSTVSFMNTGAHPDDETSALLATLGIRDGLDLAYACANRGEGGQNDIGTETTGELGTLRTAEMERAAAVLDLRLYWLSEHPGDSLFDFGFSKSGTESVGRWGRERLLHRFVEVVRTERPDILCPTFLDVPGQHGHHRAMTEAAHLVMDLAADPAHATPGLAPWRVKKLCLPAWGGGGSAYDDERPPPAATFTIEARGVEPLSGWSFERIAQQSRRFHATQGMGRWVAAGDERDWPLHLARCEVEGGERGLVAGLPGTLADVAGFVDAPRLAAPLADAQRAIDAVLDEPHAFERVCERATRALVAVRHARELCPERVAGEVLHRLRRKESRLAEVIRLAAGVDAHGRTAATYLRAGERTTLDVEWRAGTARVSIEPFVEGVWRALPSGDARPPGQAAFALVLADDAPPSDPYPSSWLPDAPCAPALDVAVTAHGETSLTRIALDPPPLALPARSATLTPDAWLLNTRACARRLEVAVGRVVPAEADVTLALPDGWTAARTAAGFTVTAPEAPVAGLHELGLAIGGRPASLERRIEHAHVRPRLITRPAALRARVLDVALPAARIAYVGGGNDRVAHWLRAVGLPVVELGRDELDSDEALSGFDTLVVGLFAMRTRPGLARAMPRVHRWIEAGGHLLTLYHRPWDGWDVRRVPPARLEIGQPSLRWRVTDERAAVRALVPDHPLLNVPNRIGESDWEGWHKERGLYFAKAWDSAYVALLSMADPDEAPHEGALLSGRFGRGRHTHTALILHHQMEHLVPGAFRLMANLVAGAAN